MFQVTVQGNTEILDKAKKVLSQQQVEDACRMAINEAANKGRTFIRRSIQDVYNIKVSRINDSDPKKGVTVKPATRANLSAFINVGHKPVSFSSFTRVKLVSVQTGQQISLATTLKRRKARTIKGRKLYGGGGVSIQVFKSQTAKVVPSAFVIGKKITSGSSIAINGTAVFARGKNGKPGFQFGKERTPIAGLGSVSIATAARNTKALDNYGPKVNNTAHERFIYHLGRLIGQVEVG